MCLRPLISEWILGSRWPTSLRLASERVAPTGCVCLTARRSTDSCPRLLAVRVAVRVTGG